MSFRLTTRSMIRRVICVFRSFRFDVYRTVFEILTFKAL